MGIFAALMWKHFIQRKRRLLITCIDIFTPFLMLFAIGIFYTEPKTPMHRTSELRVLYTPDTELTRMLMDHVAESLDLPRMDTVPKEYEKAYLWSNESQSSGVLNVIQNVDAVIVFENLQGDNLPDKLNYTVHVKPPESISLRRKLYEQPNVWLDELGESFLRLQWAIDSSFIKLKSDTVLNLQNITIKQLRRFYTGDLPARDEYNYAKYFAFQLSILIAPLLSFLFLVMRLNEEKSNGIQMLTEMPGVTPSMLVITQILNSLPACLLYSIGGALSFPQPRETNIRIDRFIIFIALFLHFMTIIAFAFPCSYITKTDQHTLSLSTFIYLAMWMFCWAIIRYNLFVTFLNGFIPHMPMIWFASLLRRAEFHRYGIDFNNWSENILEKFHIYTSDFKGGSVRTACAMQLIQIFLFLTLSWFLKKFRPGVYGVELPWNFLLQKEYWMRHPYIKKSNIDSKSSYYPPDEKYFVDSPDDGEVAVFVFNVQKVFKNAPKNIVALDKVSLRFYKGDITVLIGHNGAGKTTLLSIIAGMLKQSSGNVYVEGFDTVLHQANVRKRIGLCPQQNLFINDFTVQEHLMFFSMIRGNNSEVAKKSSQELMNRLKLSNKASWTTSKLPKATLRRLQIGCALCGNPSILLLDDPTSGLDVEDRREIWDMLLPLRGKRTVIMTTQHLEEADILGDRIIGLHAGKLRCNASPSQLKTAFGSGYRVTITTVHRPDVSNITATIRKVAPAAILKDKTLRTLVYYIPPDADMAGLFNTLEFNRTSLHIESMGFGGTSLEELFMELCADVHIDTFNDHEQVSSKRDASNNKGWNLISTQICELFKRQFDYTVSKLAPFLSLQFLIPCTLLIFTLMKYEDLRPIMRNVSPRATYSYQTNTPESRLSIDKLKRLYPRLLIQDLNENHGENCGCEKCKKNDVNPLNKNAIDIYLDDQQALLRYDPEVKHSALIGLNLLSNIIASQRLPQIRDKMINMKILILSQFEIIRTPYMNTELASLFVFIITTAVINDVALPCKDRLTSTRHIHEMAGCPPALYWLVTLTYHMACYLVFCCSGAMAWFFLIIESTISSRREMGVFFVGLLLYGFNFFLFAYVLSFFFNKRTTAIIILTLVYFFGLYFPILMIASDFLNIGKDETAKFAWIMDSIGVFIPAYMFFRTILRMLESFQFNLYCRDVLDWCISFRLLHKDRVKYYIEYYCCESTNEHTSWYFPFDTSPFSLGSSLIIVAVHILVNTTLLLLLEYRMHNRLCHEIDKRRSLMMPRRKYDSSDVTEEKNYVRNTIRRSKETIKEKILVGRVWKIYFSLFRKPTFALKDINYSVKKGECFGLIGLNGAGKTTHFKVITCEDYATKGKMFVNGQYVKCNDMRYAYSLGYCPQYYGLDYFRSGESNMITLLRLRGLSNRKAQDVTKAWFNTIGLEHHAKRAVWRYSMGMRRRLAIGCALCSRTPVKLLDEPTEGFDVAVKHVVWAVIKRGLFDGDAVVLSSNNMEEVARLCDRFTILDSGEMGVLGFPKGFKNLYAPGRTVFFKLRVSALDSAGTLRMQALKDSMYREFSCFVNSEHLTTLWFTITEKLAFDVIFVKLRLLATEYNDIVEDYSAYDGNMEDAFIQFSHESRDTIKPQETW